MYARTLARLSVNVITGLLPLCAVTLLATPTADADVSFCEYVPLTAAQHGVKTFEWTYGRQGGFTSWVGGTKVIHYGDGTGLTGVEITNMPWSVSEGQMPTGLGCNDGAVVRILGFSGYYLSTDSLLTSHPSAWSFGIVADGMIVDQRPYYWVNPDNSQWLLESTQMMLFDIQDITVLAGGYPDSVIMWTLDTRYPFTALDLAQQRPELGISLPDREGTEGFAVTGFDVYGWKTGLVASGDIDARSGQLLLAAELKEVVRPDPFGPADLVGTWQVHHLNVGDAPAWRGWSRFELGIDAPGRFHIVPGTYLNSSGETEAQGTGMMTITEEGALSMLFDGDSDNSRAEGVMASDRQLAVITMDHEGGSNLSILQKRSDTTFAPSDLAGTWSAGTVQIGDSEVWQGWTHGDVTIDAAGVMLDVPGCSHDSSGYSPGLGGVTISLTARGTLGVDGWPHMHGTLSDSRDLAVFTHTFENDAYGLSIFQRRSDRVFVTGDLSGVWRISGLATRGGTWANWVRGTWTVDTDGSSDGLLYQSDGTTSPFGGTVTMASFGGVPH